MALEKSIENKKY